MKLFKKIIGYIILFMPLFLIFAAVGYMTTPTIMLIYVASVVGVVSFTYGCVAVSSHLLEKK